MDDRGLLLENGFRQLFDQMNALPPITDDRPFLARIRGRAVLSLDLMKAAAIEVPGGSADEIERQYFGRVISEPDEAREEPVVRGPFKGLRSMLTGFREINARGAFRFEAYAYRGVELFLEPHVGEEAAGLAQQTHRRWDRSLRCPGCSAHVRPGRTGPCRRRSRNVDRAVLETPLASLW